MYNPNPTSIPILGYFSGFGSGGVVLEALKDAHGTILHDDGIQDPGKEIILPSRWSAQFSLPTPKSPQLLKFRTPYENLAVSLNFGGVKEGLNFYPWEVQFESSCPGQVKKVSVDCFSNIKGTVGISVVSSDPRIIPGKFRKQDIFNLIFSTFLIHFQS